VRTVA